MLRPVRYGPPIALVALLFGLAGATMVQANLRVGWAWAWPALSFAWVAVGYLGVGASVMGKRIDGTRAAWAYLAAGPFLLFMRMARTVLLVIRHREDPWNEVAAQTYVGRIVAFAELPSGVGTVVDLTSEFLEPASVRESAVRYECLPVLDGSVPQADELHALLERSVAWPAPVYVHCAAGHGRSALVAACMLVERGEAATVADAVARMQIRRPGVHLNREQRRLAERVMDARR